MRFVKPYLGNLMTARDFRNPCYGIAAHWQALKHRTIGRQAKSGSKRSHKEFQFLCTITILCLRRWIEDPRRNIAVDWQVFDHIQSFAGPFCFLDFASSNFYQIFDAIPQWVHTEGTGKGPRCSTHSKGAEFPMAQQNSVGIPVIGIPVISFLLSVTHVRFM